MFLERIHNRPNQKWIDIEKMKNSSLPLVMYGAGINAALCSNFLKSQSIYVDEVCVTEKKPGVELIFEGRSVITLEEVGKKFDRFNCLIAFADVVIARNNLSKMAGVYEIFVIDNPGIVEDIDYLYVKNHKDAFENTYSFFADMLSKNAFVDYLNTRISGIPTVGGDVLELQYFCDIIPLHHNEVLVDCGAYDGDTIFSFIEKTGGHYDRIYAFEPDVNNYKKLKQNIEDRNIQRVEIIPEGVWERKTILNFSSPLSTASHIVQDGDCHIEVDSIDNVVGDGRVTIVKLDIEGAELSALKGAQVVMDRERPKLALSVYHKAEDLISIPSYLSIRLQNYNFYLRRHSSFSLETVFYAIPKSTTTG